MNTFNKSVKLGALLVILAGSPSARAQVTITADDMFNKVGQYYRAYANKDGVDVSVSGLLGSPGGPQAWNFSTGPKDDIYRFDYVAVNEDGHGLDFPKANLAERKTVEATGAKAWLYFEQVPGLGRQTYGFYDPAFSAAQPSTPFNAPILDFPATIRYRDSWSTSTTFPTVILTIDTAPDPTDPEDIGGSFDIPTIINYTSTATVDAYGIINLPGVGFGEGLRVNELVTYDVRVDLVGDGQYQSVAQEYIRNYYWLMEDHGIAVQITSKQETQPPPDNFATAASFVRLFETNHPIGARPAEGVTGLTISLGKNGVFLIWDKLGTAGSYRVEYSTNPGDKNSWKPLGTAITSNFIVDSAAVSGDQTRFYRVAALTN